MLYNDPQKRIQIGIRLQEYVAIQLEKYFPEPEFTIISRKTKMDDLLISNSNGFRLTCEVKSAKELIYHEWTDKKTREEKRSIQRGMFDIGHNQLYCDFFAFVVRFVEDNFEWSENFEDTEIWFALSEDVRSLLFSKLKCQNKLMLSELPSVNATFNLDNLNLPEPEKMLDVEDLLF